MKFNGKHDTVCKVVYSHINGMNFCHREATPAHELEEPVDLF